MTKEQRIELGQELNRNNTKLVVLDKGGTERYLIKSNSQMNFTKKTFDLDDLAIIVFLIENGFNTTYVYAARREDCTVPPHLTDVLARSERNLDNALDEIEIILNQGGSIKTIDADDEDTY